MIHLPSAAHQTGFVSNFKDLVSTPFHDDMNAICFARTLTGDFAEIVNKVVLNENIVVLEEEALWELPLSEAGKLAREILLDDWKLLKDHGASPSLNIIRCYERDDACPFFPTDVYSFHVDRSPVPTDTFLCTYYGEPSELVPNAQAQQKVLVPDIRAQLKKIYHGAPEGFDSFLEEHFFDLHYLANPSAQPVSLGTGNMWRLAVDHPGSKVPPCIHRAPREKTGQHRLLMIC
ncbi:MAG TPA: hypothetical protein PLY34_08885 [Ferruginibacter sp.]|mgnify:FL=1|nr:hypothetical protein [Ferruginibacter sp.]